MARLVDSNLIIRFLVADDAKKAKDVEKLLTTTQEKLILTDVVISEIVWVLSSYYGFSKSRVIEGIEGILNFELFELDRDLIGDALNYFKIFNMDWIDAYLVAVAKKRGDKEIYSYDKDLDKVPEVVRKEP